MGSPKDFWKWFIAHQEDVFNFEVDQERIFDQLGAALGEVDSNLTFELGPKGTDREFVVSAGGVKSSFPAVISLVRAAPVLPRWNIVAFRPRRMPPGTVEFDDKTVRPEQVQFSLLDNGKIAGLRLFIPGFLEDDSSWRQIGYLLLDDVLGEYDVETRVGLLKMYSPDAHTNERRYPLIELPVAFDRLVSRLEGQVGEPS